MQIKLIRKIYLEEYDILMQIGRYVNQEHIIAFLIHVEEAGRSISPQALCDHLLPGKPQSVGRNIIQRCVDSGLMKWNDNKTLGILLDKGKKAILEKKVPRFERGIYRIVYTDDELLSPLIDCIPKNNIYVFDNVENVDDVLKVKDIEHIKNSINRLNSNEVYVPLGKEKDKIEIVKIEKIGNAFVSTVNCLVNIILYEQHSEQFLSGDYEKTLPAPTNNMEDIWFDILNVSGLIKDWDKDKKCLGVSYDSLNDKQKEKFEMDVNLYDLTINNLGHFDEITISGVKIKPKSDIDAQKWFDWILESFIDHYLTPIEYNKFVQEKRSLFKGYAITIKKQKEVAQQIKTNHPKKLPSAYWYYKAPLDIIVR